MMISDSFISMIMLGTRVCMAKYCSRIISAWSFVRLNFYVDFGCAVFIIVLSAVGLIDIPVSDYVDVETLKTGLPAGAFFTCAEIFIVMALNEGPTGPVTAVTSMNALIVSVLTWAVKGIALNWMQIVGILVAFSGIIIVASSKNDYEQKSQKAVSLAKSTDSLLLMK